MQRRDFAEGSPDQCRSCAKPLSLTQERTIIMKKSAVRKFEAAWGGNTSEYVIAHAKRQQSRGRGPSEMYRGVRNPRKALALALSDRLHDEATSRYTPMAGDRLEMVAKKVVAITDVTRRSCAMTFNEIEIVVKPGDSVASVTNFYHEEYERQSAAYKASPEAKRARREAEERLNQARAKLDELMLRLPQLDFGNLTAVIDWLGELRDPSDDVGVDTPWQAIVAKFAEHGFVPGMNTGSNFNGEDETNYARYLIGNALSGLACEVHAIHQVYRHFADQWREKFHPKAV